MKMSGYAPDVYSYTPIMHAFIVHKDDMAAFEIFQEMVDQGIFAAEGHERLVAYMLHKFSSSLSMYRSMELISHQPLGVPHSFDCSDGSVSSYHINRWVYRIVLIVLMGGA